MTMAGERPSVAMIGLGIMGEALVQRMLDTGFRPTIWNRSAAKSAALATDARITVAASPRDAAAGAEISALCLTDAAAVETVALSDEGILAGARPGTVILDFSSIGIDTTRRLAAQAAARGVFWVDAPVSGGPGAARQGTLAVLLGGDETAIAKATPLLDAVARIHTRLGASGAGQAAKLCNQMIVSTALLAIGETMAVGRHLGLDVTRLPGALAGGYADSLPLQIFGARMAAQQLEPRISEVATMRKDVQTLKRSVTDYPGALRLLDRVSALYDLAAERGMADKDLAILSTLPEVDT